MRLVFVVCYVLGVGVVLAFMKGATRLDEDHGWSPEEPPSAEATPDSDSTPGT